MSASTLSKAPPADEMVWGDIPHKAIRDGIAFLVENHHRPVNVAALWKASGMSPRGFHKAFMKHVGCSPGKLLRHMRIERAKALLGLNVKSRVIAGQCGFRSYNSFEVAFRSVTGLSPTEFQQFNRNRHVWRSTRNSYSDSRASVGRPF